MIARPDRLPGWEGALARVIAQASSRSFVYGEWDCALFVARAVLAVTGRDLRPDWSYETRADGVRLMRAAGYRDHVAYFRAHCGCLESPRLALPGDIAVMPGRSLGILQGRMVYQLTPRGMALAPAGLMREALAV